MKDGKIEREINEGKEIFMMWQRCLVVAITVLLMPR